MKTLTSNKAFWLLLVICVVTILPFLGLSEYHTKGEPREAIVPIPCWIAETGSYPETTEEKWLTNRLSSIGASLLYQQ